jgi:hypothetical protein
MNQVCIEAFKGMVNTRKKKAKKPTDNMIRVSGGHEKSNYESAVVLSVL